MSKSVGDVEMLLEEWLSDLDITTENQYIIVRTKRRLGTEIFKEIIGKIKPLGGEYISAGKESHFRIPKGQPQTATVTMEGLIYCAHCGKANKVRLEKA